MCCRKWRILRKNWIAVASRGYGPAVVLSTVTRGGSGAQVSPTLDLDGIRGCVEREVQVPPKEVEGWWAAEGLGLLP